MGVGRKVGKISGSTFRPSHDGNVRPIGEEKRKTFLFLLFLNFGPRQALIVFLVLKLDFRSQPFLNSTFPFVGLQHLQQTQVICF
jgi:hypothetical protein